MPVRVADAVAQQHDSAEANPAGVAGGGGGAGQEQTPRPRRAQRASGWREEAETHVDRGAREAVAGSVLCGAAEAVGREDRGHRGETGPQKERGPGVVLQSAAETETHEVCGPTLMGTAVVIVVGKSASQRLYSIPSYSKHVLIRYLH